MPDIGWSEWLSMMTSLVVVLALLAVTLFALKKMGVSTTKNASKSLQIAEVHNLGPRQKLMVVTINDEQILLGVTPQSINRLGNWQDSVAEGSYPASSPNGTQDGTQDGTQVGKFKRLLEQFNDRSADPAAEKKN
jgi:flagellar protein FliO/FliZ